MPIQRKLQEPRGLTNDIDGNKLDSMRSRDLRHPSGRHVPGQAWRRRGALVGRQLAPTESLAGGVEGPPLLFFGDLRGLGLLWCSLRHELQLFRLRIQLLGLRIDQCLLQFRVLFEQFHERSVALFSLGVRRTRCACDLCVRMTKDKSRSMLRR